jgi:hypothetical protein
MKKLQTSLLTALLSALSLSAQTDNAYATSPLLESDFEQISAEQTWPMDWPQPDTATWEIEDGNRFLRISSEEPGKMVMIYKEINIPEGTQELQIKWKQRVSGLVLGAQSWNDARLMLEFMDENRQALSPKPKAPSTNRDTNGWVEKEITIAVPANAHILKFMPTLLQVSEGTLDLDDITVSPVN